MADKKLGRVPKGTYDIARSELSDLYFRHSDWTDKQLATELLRLGHENDFSVPIDPTDKTIRRWLSSIRKKQQSAIYKALEETYDPVHSNSNPILRKEDITFNKEERFWLSEMSAKLDVWFFLPLGIKENRFTVRDAVWTCKILNVAPEVFENLLFIDIYLWAVSYSTKERLAEFQGEELDTASEDLYFKHKAFYGGMNYQQYETIRKERKLEMPFYDARKDLTTVVDPDIDSVTFKRLHGISSEDDVSAEETSLNKIIETIMNAYSDLDSWQMIPFIFGATVSEHPYVMPSTNLLGYLARILESMVIDARGHGLQGAWKEKVDEKSKVDATMRILNRRWKNIDELTDDARRGLVIDTFLLIDINLEKLMFVVADAFDSILVFTNLLEKYIKSETFNVGEVTTLNANAPTENNVFGWNMMFAKSPYESWENTYPYKSDDPY